MTNCIAISDISVELINSDNVPLVWMLVHERLEAAIKEWGFGEYNSEDLLGNLIVGKAQLWIVNDKEFNIRLVAVTRIIRYPRKKRMLIDILVGKGVEDALGLLTKAEAWMQQHGASEIEAHVRPGLARLLERKGAFKRSRVVLFREPKC